MCCSRSAAASSASSAALLSARNTNKQASGHTVAGRQALQLLDPVDHVPAQRSRKPQRHRQRPRTFIFGGQRACFYGQHQPQQDVHRKTRTQRGQHALRGVQHGEFEPQQRMARQRGARIAHVHADKR
jgi:hypothetical protein